MIGVASSSIRIPATPFFLPPHSLLLSYSFRLSVVDGLACIELRPRPARLTWRLLLLLLLLRRLLLALLLSRRSLLLRRPLRLLRLDLLLLLLSRSLLRLLLQRGRLLP